jgi:hypothetical protein
MKYLLSVRGAVGSLHRLGVSPVSAMKAKD